jgi:hypothetical protein
MRETHEPRMSLRSSGLRLLPLASRVGASIAQWLSPQYGPLEGPDRLE